MWPLPFPSWYPLLMPWPVPSPLQPMALLGFLSLLHTCSKRFLELRCHHSSCSKSLRLPLPTDKKPLLLPGIQGSFITPIPLSMLTGENLVLLFLEHALTFPSSRTVFTSGMLFLSHPSPYLSLRPLTGVFASSSGSPWHH